jgi:hypothetical protein
MHARAGRELAVIMLIAGLWLSAPVCAARPATSAVGARLAQAQPGMSADEAAALVRATSGGRILGVRAANGARGPVFHVKVLLDGGRVRVYVVDAVSGSILR